MHAGKGVMFKLFNCVHPYIEFIIRNQPGHRIRIKSIVFVDVFIRASFLVVTSNIHKTSKPLLYFLSLWPKREL